MKTLQKKWQMLIYAMAGMGINMLNLMVGSYLCSALLVGGFDAKDLPFQTYVQKDLVIPALWAIFAMAAKVIDGVIDIPLASLADNFRSRWGRRRPVLLIGLVTVVACFLLFLVVPNASGISLGNTIYYGIILCLFFTTYTLTMVTYYATFTEVVSTERERNFLSNVKSVCDIVYFILGYVVVRMLLNGLNVRIVALIVLPLALTMIIPLFLIKESSTRKQDGEIQKAKPVNLVASLGYTLKNKNYIIWMAVYALMTFGVQLFLGGINEYFSYTNMDMILIMGSTFAPVPFALILYNKLTKKHGFGVSFRYVLLTYSAGMLLMFCVYFLAGGMLRTLLAILAGLICSLAIGALFSVAYSVPSQLAAEEQEKTGVINSAMYFAVQGLFSGVATGIATGLVLVALKQADGGIIYLTMISGLGTLAAALVSLVLPKSVTLMGKVKK